MGRRRGSAGVGVVLRIVLVFVLRVVLRIVLEVVFVVAVVAAGMMRQVEWRSRCIQGEQDDPACSRKRRMVGVM